jgi:1-acyl-sn-glycerol-3-phosphate acyltransferase
MAAERSAAGGAGPPLRPIAAAFDGRVLALLQAALPLLLRWRLFPWLPAGIRRLEVVDGDILCRCLHRFHRGEIRLILAFRHSEVDDPLAALWLLGRDQPRRARRLGLAIGRPTHAHFLFDRGMPLWGGAGLGWLLGRLGGVSLRRGRHPDWTALRRARHLVREGGFPFALAPEGATNGHGERIGPLEPGGAQLGLWCLEDLERAGSPQDVLILPIALQYHYQRSDWRGLAQRMGALERALGLPPWPEADGAPSAVRLYPRLVRLGETLLERLERFHDLPPDPVLAHGDRLTRLRERCLAVAEERLDLRGSGTPENRCRRIEEVVWCRVYPDDQPPLRLLSPLERGLVDWRAREASLAERHMRLAECFVAVSGTYVAERPTYERFMETTLLLHDVLARLRGDRLPARPRLGGRRVRLTIGAPLSVREHQRAVGIGARRPRQRAVIASLNDGIRRSFETALI